MIVGLFAFCSLFAGMVHAKTTLSFEQWKARQERIDQRLMDQRLKEQQFQSITPQSTAQTLLTTTQNTTTPQVADSTITQIQPQRLGEAVSININAKLDGIGRKKAQAIVQYRKHHGDFKKVDELMQVKGIGEKTLAKNRSRIRLKP